MERIRQLRKERGLSQARLAVMADMDPATLNRLEQGKGNPNLKTLERVAAALGVEVADLLGKAEAPPSLEPTFNDVLAEERRMLSEKIPESVEEVLETSGAGSRWAALPDAEWRESIEGANAEEARLIYTQLEEERQTTFMLRRAMFAQDDEGPRNLATRLTGRFMVRSSQAALLTQDLALIEAAEAAATEALTAT